MRSRLRRSPQDPGSGAAGRRGGEAARRRGGEAARRRAAYFRSKLANLMFTYELQRRLAATGAETIAVAAYPGNGRTEFGRELDRLSRMMMSPRMKPLTWWLMQDPDVAALASLRAATDPGAAGGDFFGLPDKRRFTGYPEKVDSSPNLTTSLPSTASGPSPNTSPASTSAHRPGNEHQNQLALTTVSGGPETAVRASRCQ
ncbi:hypothetical protein ACQP2E_26635 [Actinoplanes sp. CA-015351]|uniref:hypothetical protein n=1 Tax=Actinoplanes sp. CA-015351 TaxID=3239897 RepID=UPI003D96DA9F